MTAPLPATGRSASAAFWAESRGPGKQFFQRRLAEGDSRQRALRSLKRRLARVVFVRLHAQQRSG